MPVHVRLPRSLRVSLLLFGVCFLTYQNSLSSPFLMDDYAMIVENRAIQDPRFLQIVPSPSKDVVYFRPLTHLLNLAAFLMFGDDPFGYHWLNLLFFYAAGVCLYELLNLLFSKEEFSFLAAVLFLTHPVNGVLVNYITTTGYSLLIIAVIAGVRCFVLSREGVKWRKICWVLSGVWFLTALLCHETAIAFPLYLAAVLFFVKDYSPWKTVKAVFPFGFILLLYALCRMQFVGFKTGAAIHPPSWPASFASYGASLGNLISYYVSNLLLLKDITLIWASPVIKDNLILRNILFAAVAVFFLAAVGFYRKQKEKSLALAWFLIGFIPLSLGCFSRPNLGFIIEPHWMLFSSIGFILLAASLLSEMYSRKNRTWGTVLACLLAVSYISTSRQYNKLWSNEEKYCRYMLSLSPQMDMPVCWLASHYLRERDYAQAREMFLKTLKGVLGDWGGYLNLGLIEAVTGNMEQSNDYYYRALAVNPNAAEAYNNLAANLIKADKWDQAQMCLQKAISLDRKFIDPKKNLAVVYIHAGKTQEAAVLLEEVLRIKPQDAYSLRALEGIRREGVR